MIQKTKPEIHLLMLGLRGGRASNMVRIGLRNAVVEGRIGNLGSLRRPLCLHVVTPEQELQLLGSHTARGSNSLGALDGRRVSQHTACASTPLDRHEIQT